VLTGSFEKRNRADFKKLNFRAKLVGSHFWRVMAGYSSCYHKKQLFFLELIILTVLSIKITVFFSSLPNNLFFLQRIILSRPEAISLFFQDKAYISVRRTGGQIATVIGITLGMSMVNGQAVIQFWYSIPDTLTTQP
jgi:hypothetical protein